MNKIKIYLDNCCFNRPYDNQNSIIIKIETEAKLYIQEKIKDKYYDLVWSYMLDYENELNPDFGKKKLIGKWKKLSKVNINENAEIIKNIELFEKHNIKGKDAVHLSCALYAKVDFFVTTDYKLIRKCKKIDFIKNMEGDHENN